MLYQYSSRTKEGVLQIGTIEASNREVAYEILNKNNLFILSLAPARPSIVEQLTTLFRHVRKSDITLFTRQLATMMQSKLALAEALKIVVDQSVKPDLHSLLSGILRDIQSGLSLSQSLEKNRKFFSPFYISLVRSAEVTGKFEDSLGLLADYLERDQEIRGKIMNALIYPAFMMLVFGGVLLILVSYVFPQLKPIFEDSHVKLPWYTQIVLNFGTFFQNYVLIIAPIIFAVVYFLTKYFKSKEGQAVFGRLILGFFGFGNFMKKYYLARITQSLYILISGGIPMVQALQISSFTVENPIYQEVLFLAADAVRRGESLSAFLALHNRYFPVFVGAMITVGERTGRLDEMLKRISDIYVRDVYTDSGKISELVQPILIVVIAALAGFLFASVLLPIYSLVQSF